MADVLSTPKEHKRRYCFLTVLHRDKIIRLLMSEARIRLFGALLFVALMASSCSNPETEKVRHLERGNQYAAEKRDEFAVVEYASAVKLDPKLAKRGSSWPRPTSG